MAIKTCVKCSKPLGRKYRVHVFRGDGSEQITIGGPIPDDEIGRVVIAVHERCEDDHIPRSRRGRPRLAPRPTLAELTKKFDADITVKRDGSRVLMLMPKMVGVME